ncbi:DNA-binding beta-propeller fold protein YncE [Anaerotaenia torta]|uniref:YIP1 family protein n=1 Tax=Anaerotaenia torta TaxID=433293 RepID=UPI003D1EE41B
MRTCINKWKAMTVLLLFAAVLIRQSVPAEAAQMAAYTTYTYDKEGNAVDSPAAYEFQGEYAGTDLRAGALNHPSDIFVDGKQNIYITDTGNNRIVILNQNFKLITDMGKFINPSPLYEQTDGMDSFAAPSAVFVTKEGHLYVADTDHNRIVEFDEAYRFVREISKPETDILSEDYVFKPVAIVVDSSGRIYCMSKNDNQGILELAADGSFIGYYGAQKVKQTIFDWFKTFFMTKEQKSRIAKVIPRTYSSMAIDEKDFIWLTSNSLAQYQRISYMKSKATEDAPIKRLNPGGEDVLVRNGTFAPGGDLLEVSSLIDVVVKDNGMYSLLDNSYNRIFTYDSKGNLLYAFGGVGTQDGVMTLCSSMAYLGDDLLVVDTEDALIVHYAITEYGRTLEQAIMADDDKDFEGSVKYWGEVLKANSNMELAYRAMGSNYLRNGYYEEALDCYENAYDPEGYSKAFQYLRTDYVKEHFLLVVAVFLAVLGLWIVFKKWVNRENRKLYSYDSKHTLKDELLYAFRVIYHPFDGFWEIKKQKRGSMRAATVILALVLLSFFYKAVGTGYIFRTVKVEYVSLPEVASGVLIPLALWCIASWALTTLFEGKGSLSDIYVMTCYSMFPVIFTNILVTVLSNGMVKAEGDFLTFLSSVGYVWMVGLIFLGTMVIHEYFFNKNLLTILSSIVGMGVMMFLALLFTTIGQKMIDFFVAVYEEVAFRL